MAALLILLLFQIETYAEAKDWIVLALIGLVSGLLGGAWADLRGKIKGLEDRLSAKVKADEAGYERLTRCEERLDALRNRRKEDCQP